ncbi:hypothetical protein [Halanaerobium saccharolyticum]|nr:hypothetical protein [Halanaerobium saccharolyticum]
MAKNNPFLPAKTINKTEDYQPFYNSKAYLKQKVGSLTYFKDQIPELRKIAEKVGYQDFNQFIKHRKLWHNFDRKIPISYLTAIGVELEVLEFTIELDQNDYQKALKVPRYPKSYIIQTRPIPLARRLPDNISEDKAIELVKRKAIIENISCVINYPSLKKIFIDTDGSVLPAYYQPEIKIKGKYIVPSKINGYESNISL